MPENAAGLEVRTIMRYSISLLLAALLPVPALSASLVGSWTCPISNPSKTVHYRFSANGRFVLSGGAQSSGVSGAYNYTGDRLCLNYGGTTCTLGGAGTDTVTIRWLSATSFRVNDPQGPATTCKRDP
jgi:hypothetical protein